MSVNVVELSQVASQPWRNGGGVTYPLLCWPHESDWWVRVSIANIDRDGPFSAFPSVTRFIAALNGAGVRLGEPLNVDVTSQTGVYRWSGEIAPQGTLIDGATRDLNVMINTARADGELFEVNGHEASVALFDTVLLDASNAMYGFVSEGSAQLIEADKTRQILPLSLVWTKTVPQRPDGWRIVGSQRLWAFYCMAVSS